MAPHAVQRVPSRRELENMKRLDLQSLCKAYGVRANLKSEELIELLLETKKPNVRTVQPTQRSLSTRRTSRAVPRNSSLIVHDLGEDGDNAVLSDENQTDHNKDPPSPQTRARKNKAYATQTRLGVGRPIAAGGKGARAVTKSASLTKKRGKSSRAVKPTEPITEEPEPEGSLEPVSARPSYSPMDGEPYSPQAGPSTLTPEPSNHSQQGSQTLDQRIAEAIAPLHRQLETLRSEMEQMNALRSDYKRLQGEVASIGSLKESISTLTAEFDSLRRQVTTADGGSGSGLHSSTTLLGKRHRASTDSDGSVQEDDEDPDESRDMSEPDKKRPRLGPVAVTQTDLPRTPPNNPQTASTLQEGSVLDTPPPFDRLPEHLGTRTPPSQTAERKREAQRQGIPIGNGNPFNFTFTVPVPPTPNPMFTMPFAYPEPPQSPTPVQPNTPRRGEVGALGGNLRSDIFQALRMSSQERNRETSGGESSLGPFLNDVVSDQGGQSLLSTIDGRSEGSEGDASRRTMYGTEMESDNRFGDFGFDGVNPSFWAPKF